MRKLTRDVDHASIREGALKSSVQMAKLIENLSGEGQTAEEIQRLLDEERRRNRITEAERHPAVQARERWSQRMRDLLEKLESELTLRAINLINEDLAKDPQDQRALMRKMLLTKCSTVEGLIKVRWCFQPKESIMGVRY